MIDRIGRSCAAVLFVIANVGFAQTEAPSAEEPNGFLGLTGWSYPQFAGADNRQTLWLPWVAADFRYIFFDSAQLQAGLHLRKTKTFQIDLVVQPRLGFAVDNDSMLIGLHRRGLAAEAGPRLRLTHGQFDTALAYYIGVGGDTAGRATSLLLLYTQTFRGFEFIPSLELRYETQGLVHYYYGIEPGEARSDRPVYDGRATLWTNVGATLLHERKHKRVTFVSVIYQRPGRGITDSPIVGKKDGVLASAGIGWMF